MPEAALWERRRRLSGRCAGLAGVLDGEGKLAEVLEAGAGVLGGRRGAGLPAVGPGGLEVVEGAVEGIIEHAREGGEPVSFGGRGESRIERGGCEVHGAFTGVGKVAPVCYRHETFGPERGAAGTFEKGKRSIVASGSCRHNTGTASKRALKDMASQRRLHEGRFVGHPPLCVLLSSSTCPHLKPGRGAFGRCVAGVDGVAVERRKTQETQGFAVGMAIDD